MPGEVNPRQAQLDAAARAQGFPSYEAYRLWTAQREMKRAPQTVTGDGARPVREASPKAQEMMSWHPAAIFNRITEALRGR
jgi:hypothetical protein